MESARKACTTLQPCRSQSARHARRTPFPRSVCWPELGFTKKAAGSTAQSSALVVHSSTFSQVTPFPLAPALQAQAGLQQQQQQHPTFDCVSRWDGGIAGLVGVRQLLTAQLSVLAVHSSSSAQATPVPEYPSLQAQVKLPVLSSQVARA
eukprot:1577528-Rhodomonas_salina.1